MEGDVPSEDRGNVARGYRSSNAVVYTTTTIATDEFETRVRDFKAILFYSASGKDV